MQIFSRRLDVAIKRGIAADIKSKLASLVIVFPFREFTRVLTLKETGIIFAFLQFSKKSF